VVSVDTAEPLIATAKRRAEVNNIVERLPPLSMSVHKAAVPDSSFDIVLGKAALHHLDLEAARNEILRVAKPGGIAVFSEPDSLSQSLSALRDRVPVEPNQESPDARPPNAKGLDDFCRPFRDRSEVYLSLFARLDRLLPRSIVLLSRLDRVLLARFPLLRRFTGQVAFVLTR
jgi:SAM-dependent methyltransferase